MDSFTVYLVRHGSTMLNSFNRMQGWIDSDLSEEGITQARQAAEKLQGAVINRAFSSDLGRAISTRNIILNQLQQTPTEIDQLPEFREVNFGFFEGLNSDDIWAGIASPYGKNSQADLLEIGGLREARKAMKESDPSHTAEDYDEVISRVKAGFKVLRDHCQSGESVLLVSHGTIIRTIIDYLGVDTKGNYPQNGGISELTVYPDEVIVEAYNQ
ncbi:histidine phosphatase family protein [Lactobacillus sp. LC28-10]|uniref:Histidine phosphatase family protein n=1 Tax=Secundilactobacillus angelensis TaxID=2722706 RepID=A0ABX1L139_9LACO|nr:histidine phosphatase family protein [Secundilactobacillus angelensis]MCH5462497.1 histidine phosphatase family protein [Secundilactobacillus angelensis]NLR18021.1 histidine phosphatase family protein [Secundilactobacillus angelensis]